MSSTKLIRHGMDTLAPPPPGTEQVRIKDTTLIKALLIAKLHEEAEEVARERGGPSLLTELGDVYEVLHTLARLHNYSMEQVARCAVCKADARGPLLMSDSSGGAVAILHKVKLE